MHLLRESWHRVTAPNKMTEDRYLGVVLVRRHVTRVKNGRLIDRPVMVWGVNSGWKIPSWLAHPLVHWLNALFCLRYGHDMILLGLAEAGHIPMSGAKCSSCSANLDRADEAERKIWRREALRDKARWLTRIFTRPRPF